MISPILEARAEIQKYFRLFLVQMKTSKSHSEIKKPLEMSLKYIPYSFSDGLHATAATTAAV